MKALDVICECDKIKPNEYAYQQKRKWVDKIEHEIREYASMYSGEKADMTFKDTENPVLYLGREHMDIYLYYVISMIDLSNQEYALYNNSSSYFNSVFSDWKKFYRRKNKPACNISIKL